MITQKVLYPALFAVLMLLSPLAKAETFFLENAKSAKGGDEYLEKINAAALDAVLGEDKSLLAVDKNGADYFLLPSIRKVKKGLIVKIEKRNKAGKSVFLTSSRPIKVEDLDKAVADALVKALHAPDKHAKKH